MSVDMLWRVALMSVVFLADVVVFIGLCRDELREWRAQPSVRDVQPAWRKVLSAIPLASR